MMDNKFYAATVQNLTPAITITMPQFRDLCNKARAVNQHRIPPVAIPRPLQQSQSCEPAQNATCRSTAILQVRQVSSFSALYSMTKVAKKCSIAGPNSQEVNEDVFFPFRGMPPPRSNPSRLPCVTRRKVKLTPHGGNLLKTSAVLYESQTATVLAAPFMKTPNRKSASVSTENDNSKTRVVIFDTQIYSAWSNYRHHSHFTLTQQAEKPTIFTCRAMITDLHVAWTLGSLTTADDRSPSPHQYAHQSNHHFNSTRETNTQSNPSRSAYQKENIWTNLPYDIASSDSEVHNNSEGESLHCARTARYF